MPVLLAKPTSISAQAGDAWQLIADVNALRAAYGLAPYEINNDLMSAAQRQSDYQASIGTWTHTGPNGSRPYDRAVAAGYGGGAQVFVSENVAMGIDLGTSRTVNDMWQDSIHLETMISPLYTHIGAGVGHADGWVYYTIVVGYVAGSSGSSTASEAPPAPDSVEADQAAPLPTVVAIEPIAIATPAEDGSIQHVVALGQFLENIANAYEIELDELLALNGLTGQSVIYPGDKLLIQEGSALPTDSIRTITPTIEPEPTASPTIAATEAPVQSTPTPIPLAMNTLPQQVPATQISTEAAGAADNRVGNADYLLYAVFGLAVAGTAMILLGSTLKRRA